MDKLTEKQRRSRANLRQFQPGQSGNIKGRPKREFCIPEILRDQGDRILDPKTKQTFIESMCLKAWEQAVKGDKDARSWITDRMEGKATQFMNIETIRPKYEGKNPKNYLYEYIKFTKNGDA